MGTGITNSNVSCFHKIKGLADTIYITACGAGRIARGSTPGGAGDGHAMLSQIARFAEANVIAGTELQARHPVIPFNHIDSFEGLVVYYNRRGHIQSSIRHSSVWQDASTPPGTAWGDNG